MKLIFATGNQGKMKEIREIMKGVPYPVLSLKDAGLVLDAEENGTSFAENAVIKARAGAELAGGDCIVMADDSGLVIDALGGEPGIYSARYMGEDTSYHIKNHNLIERLEGVPDEKRTARFVCAIAAVLPDGTLLQTEGVVEGLIDYDEKGENGFGYDPIFYIPEMGRTGAELSDEEKNSISHRGRALRAMRAKLEEYYPE